MDPQPEPESAASGDERAEIALRRKLSERFIRKAMDRRLRQRPMTTEEAEAEWNVAEPVSSSGQRIEEIARFAMSGGRSM